MMYASASGSWSCPRAATRQCSIHLFLTLLALVRSPCQFALTSNLVQLPDKCCNIAVFTASIHNFSIVTNTITTDATVASVVCTARPSKLRHACPERCSEQQAQALAAPPALRKYTCCAVPGPATQCGAGSDSMGGEGGAGLEAPGGRHHAALQQAGPLEDRHPPAAPLGGPGGRRCMAHYHSRQGACQQTWRNGVCKPL